MNNIVAITQFLLKRGVISSSSLWRESTLKGPQRVQEIVKQKGKQDVKVRKDSKANIWRKIVFLMALPALVGVMALVFTEKLKETEHEKPEFIPYEYLRRRTKRFPWRDGNRSLFHNPKVNPLPDGYENLDEVPEAEKEIVEAVERVSEKVKE